MEERLDAVAASRTAKKLQGECQLADALAAASGGYVAGAVGRIDAVLESSLLKETETWKALKARREACAQKADERCVQLQAELEQKDAELEAAEAQLAQRGTALQEAEARLAAKVASLEAQLQAAMDFQAEAEAATDALEVEIADREVLSEEKDALAKKVRDLEFELEFAKATVDD